ncbi:MAG: bifunctional DNA-formamidopyrimidine glycosylase/DNA-(apurinic or apyrimidinic site) lyase [Gammaproteobacteria bacterium]|nr:bifunctional DNA-formamidopyrimidine glycosylase/DNA-(apurinic or apyrimidinic site) lyase [Gammaproteobacteria bacterium]MDA8022429.1 bifunctional DNA-formamidopyrimidine glycosylase/DNA-(apurinic or apyrimidinic site) lyase [Gammaproteobacteria bacterium]
MPELPEVETTLNGIRPDLLGAKIRLVVRERRLRWPIEPRLEAKVRGRTVTRMRRRGKYMLLYLDRGALLMHLGMSGSFRTLAQGAAVAPHDHYDLLTDRGRVVRYRDPRRFGCLLWCGGDPMQHERIRMLGVEPLSAEFNGAYLRASSRGRTCAVKILLMNGRVVTGIGNIYASEALFDAGIHPLRACHRISEARYRRLCESVKKILARAIARGGSTIRDFSNADGLPGYFEQELTVYDREGQTCFRCRGKIRCEIVGQRSTFFCGRCQR